MRWPFVRRSRYENAKVYGVNSAKEIVDLTERNKLCESQLNAKNKMLDEFITVNGVMCDELTDIKQDVEVLRAMVNASQITNAGLNIENTKLFQNNIDLLFAKKDLKQKIRKLESENSKLKNKNESLDSHCKWLYSNFRRFKEQIEKSGYFKD